MRRVLLGIGLLVGTLVGVTGGSPPAHAGTASTVAVGSMWISPGLWDPVWGPEVNASWGFSSSSGIPYSVWGYGSLQGFCERSTLSGTMTVGGNLTTNRSETFNVEAQSVGDTFLILGSDGLGRNLTATAHIRPLPSFSGSVPCVTESATNFIVTLLAVVVDPFDDLNVLSAVTTTTTINLPPIGGGPVTQSNHCTATPQHESTTLGVHVKLVYQPEANGHSVCVRADDNGTGYGGWLEITNGIGAPPVPQVPTTDTQSGACGTAPGNALPWSHPLHKGSTAGVTTEFDAYSGPGESGTGEVWVCVQAGSVQERVKIRTGTPSLPTLPTVAWHPDQGTPGV